MAHTPGTVAPAKRPSSAALQLLTGGSVWGEQVPTNGQTLLFVYSAQATLALLLVQTCAGDCRTHVNLPTPLQEPFEDESVIARMQERPWVAVGNAAQFSHKVVSAILLGYFGLLPRSLAQVVTLVGLQVGSSAPHSTKRSTTFTRA